MARASSFLYYFVIFKQCLLVLPIVLYVACFGMYNAIDFQHANAYLSWDIFGATSILPAVNALLDNRFKALWYEGGRATELEYIAYYKKRVTDVFYSYYRINRGPFGGDQVLNQQGLSKRAKRALTIRQKFSDWLRVPYFSYGKLSLVALELLWQVVVIFCVTWGLYGAMAVYDFDQLGFPHALLTTILLLYRLYSQTKTWRPFYTTLFILACAYSLKCIVITQHWSTSYTDYVIRQKKAGTRIQGACTNTQGVLPWFLGRAGFARNWIPQEEGTQEYQDSWSEYQFTDLSWFSFGNVQIEGPIMLLTYMLLTLALSFIPRLAFHGYYIIRFRGGEKRD